LNTNLIVEEGIIIAELELVPTTSDIVQDSEQDQQSKVNEYYSSFVCLS
jgi:hypothetical protein